MFIFVYMSPIIISRWAGSLCFHANLRVVDRVLLPSAWAYPDKTVWDIVQVRIRRWHRSPTFLGDRSFAGWCSLVGF